MFWFSFGACDSDAASCCSVKGLRSTCNLSIAKGVLRRDSGVPFILVVVIVVFALQHHSHRENAAGLGVWLVWVFVCFVCLCVCLFVSTSCLVARCVAQHCKVLWLEATI